MVDDEQVTPKSTAWVGRARWFAAELLVVVAGILIALALQSWWNGHSDRARERRYLSQLRADLVQTERDLHAADSGTNPHDAAGARALRAFYQSPPPSQDSLLVWIGLAFAYESSRPVLGTAEALVSTGDVGLIQSDSLRSAITNYVDVNRLQIDEYMSFVRSWVQAATDLTRLIDPSALYISMPAAALDSIARADPLFSLPPGPRVRPFPPFDPSAFLHDRMAWTALAMMNVEKINMRGARKGMLSSAISLREQVERALQRL